MLPVDNPFISMFSREGAKEYNITWFCLKKQNKQTTPPQKKKTSQKKTTTNKKNNPNFKICCELELSCYYHLLFNLFFLKEFDVERLQ